MNKNTNKRKNKGLQAEYKGYAFYDSDLNEKYFTESIQEVINLHDVFQAKFENKKVVEKQVDYSFDKLNYLDQISLMNAPHVKEQALKQAAEFKLVFFNNNLRGYYYRFDATLFDERSVKLVLMAIEKQYFKGKYKQTSSSYMKYTQAEKPNFSHFFRPGQYQSKERTMVIDEPLSKRIKAFMKQNDVNGFQFFAGVIALYFKTSRGKRINFESNFLNQNTSALVGRINEQKSYYFKDQNTLNESIQSNLVEKNQNSSIHINVVDDFKDLKGQIIQLASQEMLEQIAFNIEEKDWSFDLHIRYQKYKYKHDDIFLMMNKLKIAIYAALESPEMATNSLSLITNKEEQIAKSMLTVKHHSGQSLYETFNKTCLKNNDKVAIISGSDTITFKKLSELIAKLSKGIAKSGAGILSISPKNDFEKIAMFIACDQQKVTYDFDHKHAIMKKGLFGYKTSGTSTKSNGQYHLKDVVISRQGYLDYSNWFKNYFAINESDCVLANDLLGLGIPSLIQGASIVLGDESQIDPHKVTLAAIGSDTKAYPSLKKAIVDTKKVETIPAYKLYYGVKFDGTVPYGLMSGFQRNYVDQLKTVDGLGIILLKQNKLPEAYQKASLYVFGSGVDTQATKEKEIDGDIKHVVKQKLKGSWFIDGSLRL